MPALDCVRSGVRARLPDGLRKQPRAGESCTAAPKSSGVFQRLNQIKTITSHIGPQGMSPFNSSVA